MKRGARRSTADSPTLPRTRMHSEDEAEGRGRLERAFAKGARAATPGPHREQSGGLDLPGDALVNED